MDVKDIQKLLSSFEDSDSRELEFDDGNVHLYLSKNKQARGKQPAQPAPAPAPAPAQPAQSQAPVKEEKKAESTPAGTQIKAPLVGTVYLQPKPGKPTYVKKGDHINKGDVVCVIEAMKMMTEIKSDYSGTIVSVDVADEELVEVEQPLFTIQED